MLWVPAGSIKSPGENGACLGVEEGFSHVGVVVKVEEDCGAAGVALESVQLPVTVVLHEVKAQLSTHLGLLAKVPHPIPDLAPTAAHFISLICVIPCIAFWNALHACMLGAPRGS